jgi:hypothetical protein
MKMKHILLCSISFFLLTFFLSAQEKEVKTDSIKAKKPPKKYHSIFVGADLILPSYQFLNDRKGARGFIQYQYKERTSLILEGGYEKNTYNKINWLVNVGGVFFQAGINYFFLIDKQENNFNGFYVGGRVANANYAQEIKQYPIYGTNTAQLVGMGSLEKASVNSTWMELVFGSRVDFIKQKLYADMSVRPKIHLFSTKQENIKPLVIPGFGANTNDLNFDVSIALVYQINLIKK